MFPGGRTAFAGAPHFCWSTMLARVAAKSAAARSAVQCGLRSSRAMSTFYTEDHEYVKVRASKGVTCRSPPSR